MSLYENDEMSLSARNSPARYVNQGVSGVCRLDLSLARVQVLNLTGNVIIGQPVNPPGPDSEIIIKCVQDATGSRTVTWAACWRDAPNWSAGGAASTRASAKFIWDGFSYQFVGGSSAFAVSGSAIYPYVGGLSLSGASPVVKQSTNAVIAPGAGAVALAGVAPGFQRNSIVAIAPGAGGISLTGVAPNLPRTITPQVGTVTLAGVAPTRSP